jgi:hypothetical protein
MDPGHKICREPVSTWVHLILWGMGTSRSMVVFFFSERQRTSTSVGEVAAKRLRELIEI